MLNKNLYTLVVFLLVCPCMDINLNAQNQDTVQIQNTVKSLDLSRKNQYLRFNANSMTQEELKHKTISKQNSQYNLFQSNSLQNLILQEIEKTKANIEQDLEYKLLSEVSQHFQIDQNRTNIIPEDPYLEEIYSPQRLYGPSQFDSRIEIAQLDPRIEWQFTIGRISESVAMVVEKEHLIKISKNDYILSATTTLGKRFKLCEGESFENQMTVGTGTAFVIDKDKMITAAHVFQKPLKDYAVIFGYRVINQLGTAEISIPAIDVYFIDSIKEKNRNLDAVIFKVDRIFNRPALKWEKSALLNKGDEVYMIGYPMGLPQKLTINADITDNILLQYFYSSLDGFQGNSGSPIFNLKTNKVIGILVSGMIDFELHGNCYRTTLCKQPYCIGEKAIRIEMVLKN